MSLASNPPVTQTIGDGPDTLVLKISQDDYNGPPQYVIFVGSTQYGGTLTASALHSDGLHDTITVKGTFGVGPLRFDLRMVNDLWDGFRWWELPSQSPVGHRRDLYVDGASYNGVDIPNSAIALMDGGYHGVDFVGTAPPPPPVVPTNQELWTFGEANPGKVNKMQMILGGSDIAMNLDVMFDPDGAGPLLEKVFPATIDHASSADLAFAKNYVNRSDVMLTDIQSGTASTTLTFTLQAQAPDSVSLLWVPAAAFWPPPVPAGTVLGQLQATPTNWSGTVSLSGNDAVLFSLDAHLNLSAKTQLTTARDYVIIATPSTS